MKRFRNFCFTWNNYPQDYKNVLEQLDARYLLAGEEVGEQGTPHLQGTVVFKTVKSEPQVRKMLPGCHVEITADIHKSIEYCKKDDKFVEWGTAPKSNKKIGEDEQERWTRIREACEDGRMDDVDAKIRFTMYKACEHFRTEGSKKRKLNDTEEKHEWYYGAARTGKSRKARTDHPEAYLKMCNKWWDGYEDESIVLIEDFDKRHEVLVHQMKKWADRYPFLAEIKGGARKIRPDKIIVTSNYHPAEIWTHQSDLEPILDRFTCTKFLKLPEKKREKPYLPNTHDP